MSGVPGTVTLKNGECTITYSTEATMQTALVRMAESFGWIPESELVVPGWGRLDLVLHSTTHSDFAHVFEFKLALTKLSLVRKAFQQADGYSRWLESQGVSRRVILAAPEIDWDACNDAAYAYRSSVNLMKVGNAMGIISGSTFSRERLARTRDLYESVTRRQRLVLHAHSTLVAAEHARARRDAIRNIPSELVTPAELSTLERI